MTLIGMMFVNTYRASVFFHNDTRTFMEYTTVLSKSMMLNTIDSSHGSNAPAGSGAPGAPSPDRVPVNPSEHRVISMKAVGWRGNN
jgi:hypothetical protein